MNNKMRLRFPLPGRKDLQEPAYFFDDGLRFECQRCGGCCTGEAGTIYIARDEIGPIAAALKVTRTELIRGWCYPFRDSFSLREKEDGQCCLYDHGCTIYAVRPRQCSTWPFWFDIMRSETRWQKAACKCPGIGRGRLHSREEILGRIAASYPGPAADPAQG
jgi:Fe-S-cluster containining protein